MEVLESIPFQLEPEEILERLHLPGGDKEARKTVEELVEMVRPVAKPKAVYEIAYVDSKGEDWVDIGGVRFASRVLRVNLDKVERVFFYVATCGRELDEVAVPSDDFMMPYYLDTIKAMALGAASGYLNSYLKEKYALGQMSQMAPGRLQDWPITQQKELFSIFGNVEDLIGVKLSDSFLMVPVKSVSGMYFPTEIRFESCQLCPREVCRGRRAPYDPELAKKYGIKEPTHK